MKRIAVALTAALTLIRPPAAAAQSGSGPSWDVALRAGVNVSARALGPVAPAGPAWHIDLQRPHATPTFELAVRTHWPGRIVGGRLVAGWTVPADANGFFNCNPGLACPAVLLPSAARVSSMSVVGDVVIAPRERARIRPWVAAGAGLRHYDYSWSDAAVLVDAGSHSENALAVHAGAGIEVTLPVGTLQAEIADYWSPRGAVIAGIDGDPIAGATVRRNAQHNLVVNVGWRVVQF